jgi:hypothetical protein
MKALINWMSNVVTCAVASANCVEATISINLRVDVSAIWAIPMKAEREPNLQI